MNTIRDSIKQYIKDHFYHKFEMLRKTRKEDFAKEKEKLYRDFFQQQSKHQLKIHILKEIQKDKTMNELDKKKCMEITNNEFNDEMAFRNRFELEIRRYMDQKANPFPI